MTIGRRLQVHHEDLEPSLNPGAQYFVEGHYIALDDAQARNGLNNASYRQINVSGGGTNFSISLTGTTQREQPAIQAWADFDPDATVVKWPVTGEGLFWLATKVTDKGEGWFLYDYAVQNLNSDRAGSAFSVRVFPGTPLRNIGFHDVDSHSGEPYELTDWEVVQIDDLLTWQTDDCQANPDTNALRWGTMYNFWFEARKEPVTLQGAVQLRLCKTGSPDLITNRTTAPEFSPTDCNDNGVPDDEDISSGTSEDCTGNLIPDECEGDDDGDGIWNPCDICDLGDNTQDEDSDGVPDACDACPGFDDNPDTDEDGVPNCLDRCPNTAPGETPNFCGCTHEPVVCGPDLPPFPHNRSKNRYLSFAPNLQGMPVKLRVSLTDSVPHPGLIGSSWWVQEPITPVAGQFPKPALGPAECVATLGPEATAAWIDWDAAGCQVLHVTGCPIEPTSVYDVQAVAGEKESDPFAVATILKPGGKWWCDTVGIFNGTEWTPAQGVTNIDDAVAAIETWQGGQVVPPGPIPPGTVAHLSVPDIEPGNVNTVVNFADVQRILLAFEGEMYPFGPADADGNCP
ncbi:MAG: thrombospondin type 3 repeat-containing protein [Planctomycetes bacterium]|nr:thrombospondin type 3 repeat-containing protein [Planctomycetota bacterium]